MRLLHNRLFSDWGTGYIFLADKMKKRPSYNLPFVISFFEGRADKFRVICNRCFPVFTYCSVRLVRQKFISPSVAATFKQERASGALTLKSKQ